MPLHEHRAKTTIQKGAVVVLSFGAAIILMMCNEHVGETTFNLGSISCFLPEKRRLMKTAFLVGVMDSCDWQYKALL